MIVIGVDCATDETKTGAALAVPSAGSLSIREVVLCSRRQSAAARIAQWLHDPRVPALLAIDAPLGWPEPLSRVLANHQAGDRLPATANEMFRRTCDRFIQRKLSKTPLDVGADRIARTAHAALVLLTELRERLGVVIPLAWKGDFAGVAAIEVYPAATLVAHEYRSNGYKRPEHIEARREIIASLSTEIHLGPYQSLLEQSADALDATVCVLAGKDFLQGRAMTPEDQLLAQREGWIWAASRRRT